MPDQPVAPAPDPAVGAASTPVPGDRRPGRLLDHPPSDRYAAHGAGAGAASSAGRRDATARAGSPVRAVLLAATAAVAGAAIHLATAVALEWTGGLLLVAATAGLATGLAVRFGGGTTLTGTQRRLLGVAVAVAAIVAALILNWAVSPRYLAPTDYLDQVYGSLVPLQLAAAAAGALVGTR